MGGYGAFLIALSEPEKYAAAANLSGALDLAWVAENPDPVRQAWARRIFADPPREMGGDADPIALAKKLAGSDRPQPQLYACCGTEDYLIESNRHFLTEARAAGLELTYEEHPGVHEWGYWDRQIDHVVKWLPIRSSSNP